MVTIVFKEVLTPYEKGYGAKPNVSHLRVLGCICIQ